MEAGVVAVGSRRGRSWRRWGRGTGVEVSKGFM